MILQDFAGLPGWGICQSGSAVKDRWGCRVSMTAQVLSDPVA